MQTTDEFSTPTLKLIKPPKVQGTESLSFSIETDDYSIDQMFLDADGGEVHQDLKKDIYVEYPNWESFSKRQQELMQRIDYYLGELKDHLL